MPQGGVMARIQFDFVKILVKKLLVDIWQWDDKNSKQSIKKKKDQNHSFRTLPFIMLLTRN